MLPPLRFVGLLVILLAMEGEFLIFPFFLFIGISNEFTEKIRRIFRENPTNTKLFFAINRSIVREFVVTDKVDFDQRDSYVFFPFLDSVEVVGHVSSLFHAVNVYVAAIRRLNQVN